MKKLPVMYLEDVLKAIEMIEKYLDGYDYDRLVEDFRTQDAVIRQFIVIGEAVKKLDGGLREKYPELPWREMAGLRDVLVHDYDKVLVFELWDVCSGGELTRVKDGISKVMELVKKG